MSHASFSVLYDIDLYFFVNFVNHCNKNFRIDMQFNRIIQLKMQRLCVSEMELSLSLPCIPNKVIQQTNVGYQKPSDLCQVLLM